jgi:hypothetical protein
MRWNYELEFLRRRDSVRVAETNPKKQKAAVDGSGTTPFGVYSAPESAVMVKFVTCVPKEPGVPRYTAMLVSCKVFKVGNFDVAAT